MDPEAWVPLAEIARPHGVKGELRLRLFNKSSDLLLEQDEVLVRLPDGEEHEVSVDRARRADDAILMKLYSVDDRDRADELRGSLICVKRSAFPPPEEGEFYAVDVVGAEAFLDDVKVGVVVELIAYPSIDVMLVRGEDKGEGVWDWEVPVSEGFVAKVDAEKKRVDLLTMDGIERQAPPKPKAPKPAKPKPGEKKPK